MTQQITLLCNSITIITKLLGKADAGGNKAFFLLNPSLGYLLLISTLPSLTSNVESYSVYTR